MRCECGPLIEGIRRLAVMIVVTSVLPCSMFPQASHSPVQSQTEDHVFDKHRVTPLQLLRNLYETHRVLVLAFADHNYETQYQMLDSLLQSIGRDPRLKLILLERASEDAPMLQVASTTSLTIPDIINRFQGKDSITGLPSKRRASFSVCLDPEFAYTWSQFLPHIRALNAKRSAGNPIQVTTIDGVSAADVIAAQSPPDALAAMESPHRESTTAANFWRTLWPQLGPSSKVIMVYHVGHVIKTFTVVDDDGQLVPSNWMATLLRDHPEVESQIGIVLLDPINAASSVLRFTQRQGARHPDTAFGVPLAPFQKILTQPDTATFVHVPRGPGEQAEGMLRAYGTDLKSSRSLPAMLNGVVGLPDVSPWSWESIESYVPECGSMHFRVSGG